MSKDASLYVSYPKRRRKLAPNIPDFGGLGDPDTWTEKYKALVAQSQDLRKKLWDTSEAGTRLYGPVPHPPENKGGDSNRKDEAYVPFWPVQATVNLPDGYDYMY